MKAHKTIATKPSPAKGATARIITCDRQVLGEITGTPTAIARVRDLIYNCEEQLGCRFEIIHTDDPRTIRINAVPRKNHQIKAQEGAPAIDPKQVLLHAIFSNDHPTFPGSVVHYQQ